MLNAPAVILPGYLAGAAPYREMEQALQQQGVTAFTVPLRWHDWLPTIGGRPVTPILQKLDQAIRNVCVTQNCERVHLIGHSAGGWLARIYLGDQPYGPNQDIWSGHQRVISLVTLGTPHCSQERWTKRNIDFVNNTYPGAYHAQIPYLCIAGKAIYGQRRLKTWIAYNSYQLTVGEGNSWGDGITPVPAAHLAGAHNVTLPGVVHSPGTQTPWYGTTNAVAQWVEAWLALLARSVTAASDHVCDTT